MKADEIVQKCLKEARLINDSIEEVKKTKKKSEVLLKAYQLLSKDKKPLLETVRELCI